MSRSRSIAVIGLGTFGGAMVQTLGRFGDHVLGVDLAESNVARHGDVLARAVIGDAREARVLEEAGIGSYEVCVVAMATDIEANLLAVMNAKALGVPEVWAKATTDTHARILEQVGVDRVLRPEETFGEQLAQVLHNPLVRGSVRLAGDLHLAQIEAPRRICGHPLAKVRFGERHDLMCLGLLRGLVPVPADPAEVIEPGDTLLLVGTRPAMRAFADRG